MKTMRWTVPVALACAALFGCQKSSETQKSEADKAAAEAEQKQTEAANQAAEKSRDAKEKAAKERDDLHATVVREKQDYRGKIDDAIDSLNKDLTDMKIDMKTITRGDRSRDYTLYGARPGKDYDKIENLLLRRDRLMNDADQVDSTIDHDWPSFKERINMDLEKGKMPVKLPGRT